MKGCFNTGKISTVKKIFLNRLYRKIKEAYLHEIGFVVPEQYRSSFVHWGGGAEVQYIYMKFTKDIHSGARILIVGVMGGRDYFLFKNLGYKVDALDIGPQPDIDPITFANIEDEIPFADESFDLLYSMGTIEHFPEYFQAVSECFRVLRRKGLAIIGVPNKFDPFLRPLLVAALYKLGLYSYGYEKSFSMSQLEKMLEKAGFQILERTGILFMTGSLRMVDLYLHVNRPGLTVLTSPFVSFFRFLYRKFPWLRPHGYLIACVVRKS